MPIYIERLIGKFDKRVKLLSFNRFMEVCMRRIPMTKLQEGSVIATNIYDINGNIVVRENFKVNETIIDILKKYNVLAVYIIDEYSPSIIKDSIEVELRIKVVSELRKMAQEFSRVEDGKKSKFIKTNYIKNIENLVNMLIDELYKKEELLIEQFDTRNWSDYYFYHSTNVAIMSIIIGMELNYNRKKLLELAMAAILHDIGFALLPKEIVYKFNGRTEDEIEILKSHCEKGYKYLSNYNIDREVLYPLLNHHEKVDGTGYPRGLKNKQIDEFSKIIAIADYYDEVMHSGFILEESMPNDILEQIMAYVGSSFDFELVKVFYKKVKPFLKGTVLRLSNGDVALVEGTIKGFPLRPIVRVIESKDSTKIGKCINLVDNLDISIVELIYYL